MQFADLKSKWDCARQPVSKIQNTFKDANLALGVDDVSIYFLAHISSHKPWRGSYAAGGDAGDGECGSLCLSERSDELREVFAGAHPAPENSSLKLALAI